MPSNTNTEKQGLSITLINETETYIKSLSSKNGCVISPVCRLKGVFFEALTAFVTVLESYTLADIISNKLQLADILN